MTAPQQPAPAKIVDLKAGQAQVDIVDHDDWQLLRVAGEIAFDPITTVGWEAIDQLVNALITRRTAVYIENTARWAQVDVGQVDPTSNHLDHTPSERTGSGSRAHGATSPGPPCAHVWTEEIDGESVRRRCTRTEHLDHHHVHGDGDVVVARTPPRVQSIFEQFGLDPGTGLPRPEDPAPPTLRDVDPTAHGGRP